MRLAWIFLVLSLALAAGPVGCGPKNKYCPDTGGPCYPPGEIPDGGDGGDDADGETDGEAGASATDAGDAAVKS